MEPLPSVCPLCGDQMSTPLLGRHSRRLLSTCRNDACRHTIHSSEPVSRAEDLPRRPGSSDHGMMFRPDTAKPEPPRPRPGAMQRFNQAVVGGTVRKAIQQQRRTAAEAAAIDPKLHQLPESDR